ncbi:APR protein, partial [Columbina picui]|nr:APR protein [Columbina picui]
LVVRVAHGRACALAEREVAAECALQLRRIGDKWDLRQRILNLLTKLFFPGT